MTIKGIIFDIGGVIHPINWETSGSLMGVASHDFREAMLRDRENHFNHYEKGHISSEEFAGYVLGNLGLPCTQKNLVKFSYSLEMQWDAPNLDVMDIIKRIKPGILKGLLSNCCPELEKRGRSFSGTKYEYFSLFAPHDYMSHHIGEKKPHQGAFDHVVKGMGLLHDQCVFVDDKPDNIDAAESIGLRGIHYTGAKDLESKLLDLGVIINDENRS